MLRLRSTTVGSRRRSGRVRAIGWLLCGSTLAGSFAWSAEPPVLRVGMDTRSRPWAFVPGLDYTKEDWNQAPRLGPTQLDALDGVEIDIMKALARRMGVVPKVVPCAWVRIEQSLVEKRFDVILNAWVPNSRTPSSVVASSPYYEWGLLIVVKADNQAIHAYADLAGTRVGYFRDLAVERTVFNVGARELVPVDDSDLLFDDLAAGRIDAAIEDSTFVRWRVAHDARFRIVGDRLNKIGYRMGLRKEDAQLLEKVEAAIRDLVASGETDKIRARWESADAPGPR